MPLKKIDDYPAYLEAAWREHLQSKPDNAPTVISTFAGCGGSSLGYSMAGFRELLAVEWDNNAVETFKLNFPDVPMYHGDIAKISVEEVLSMTGLKVGELDILDGSPPCQGFSTAGKRQLDDPRNQLFREYVRLLRGLKPKVFVMENVSGMVKGVMKLVFVEILKELKSSGYKVSARLLNAMYFGVPQSRQRMIFIGVREDLGIEPSHPEAESLPIPMKSACPDIDYLVLDAHGYDDGRIVNASVETSPVVIATGMSSYKYEVLQGVEFERWQSIPVGGNWQDLPKELINGKAKYSNFHRKLDPERPSFTLGKEEHFSSGRFYHWKEPRRLTDLELKMIGSFPVDFDFVGDGKIVHKRIGNSVPPLFMRSIANHIRNEILTPETLT